MEGAEILDCASRLVPPDSVTGRLVEREDGTAAGDVDHTIGNSRCLCQRTEVRRRECPKARPGKLIDGDGITTVSYVNGVVIDAGADVIEPDSSSQQTCSPVAGS